jgi:ABC-2 type transport system permease protein
MFAALFYLQYHSVKNRTLMRIKRLKQPKYLFGALVGGLYFYFYFFRYLLSSSGPGRSSVTPFAFTDEVRGWLEALGALILFVLVVLAWVIPHERTALAFSEAEVAFLFPAPISRRGLIHFKLLRSQMGIFFTTLLLTLVTRRMGGSAWIHAAGWWLILSTLNLHFLGSSFVRTMLLDRGITNWQRRLAVLGFVLGLGGAGAYWVSQTIPAFDLQQMADLEALKTYGRQVLISGPVPFALYPFRLIVRPYLAPGPGAFLAALLPALGLMLAHYVWVLRSNVAFEEASVDASRKLADKVAALRSGNWQAASQKLKVRRAPFKLHPTGPPAFAFLWKNLISAGQMFTFRLWLMLAIVGVSICIGVGQGSARASELASVFGFIALAFLVWSLLIGPQILRQDFRQDLALADVLKSYPLSGWQIALGELLAPATVLTFIQWFLLLVGAAAFLQARKPGIPPAILLGATGGAACLFPVLNVITLQIPNAAVLLFPAWFQSGKEGPQGIEATGQRLIAMLAQLLVFLLVMIPASLGFLVVFYLGKLLLGAGFGVFAGGLAATAVLAVEAAFGLLLLGRIFERLDISAELPAG